LFRFAPAGPSGKVVCELAVPDRPRLECGKFPLAVRCTLRDFSLTGEEGAPVVLATGRLAVEGEGGKLPSVSLPSTSESRRSEMGIVRPSFSFSLVSFSAPYFDTLGLLSVADDAPESESAFCSPVIDSSLTSFDV
jgi:hypothetical protein